MLKGIDVVLHVHKQTAVDGFNHPVYEDATETVHNVLVAPSSEQDVVDTLNLTGRKAVYTLGIPKGDQHEWENTIVEFFGSKWQTIGMPIKGIDEMIPLAWNTKVRVERYGGKN